MHVCTLLHFHISVDDASQTNVSHDRIYKLETLASAHISFGLLERERHYPPNNPEVPMAATL